MKEEEEELEQIWVNAINKLHPITYGHLGWIFGNYVKKGNWKWNCYKEIRETKCKVKEEKEIRRWLIHRLLLSMQFKGQVMSIQELSLWILGSQLQCKKGNNYTTICKYACKLVQ